MKTTARWPETDRTDGEMATKYNKWSGNEERVETHHDRRIRDQVNAHNRRTREKNEARMVAEHGTADPFELLGYPKQ